VDLQSTVFAGPPLWLRSRVSHSETTKNRHRPQLPVARSPPSCSGGKSKRDGMAMLEQGASGGSRGEKHDRLGALGGTG
jgi:hypothetical protein